MRSVCKVCERLPAGGRRLGAYESLVGVWLAGSLVPFEVRPFVLSILRKVDFVRFHPTGGFVSGRDP